MRILTLFVILCASICTACANEDPYYDLGKAAYERGHYQASLYDFETRAVKGDIVAQFCLGFMYKHGNGVAVNYEKAMEWYERAATQGYAPAQNNLGVIYVRNYEFELENRRGNPETIKTLNQKAEEWFKKAAAQGHAAAQFNLGSITTDAQERLKWWRQAASQDYALAQSALGNMYWQGYIVDQNFTEAVKWYSKAVAQKHPDAMAQHNLGLCYANGQGIEKDLKEAFKLFKASAEQGSADGQFQLAQAYNLGEGTDKNPKEAFRWYKTAAEKGNVRAQNNLAVMYSVGDGIPPKNIEMANRWFFRAAQQGLPIAQVNIAENFKNNLDKIPQDFSEAYYWYSLALTNESELIDDSADKGLVPKINKELKEVRNQLDQSDKERRREIQEQIDNWQPKIPIASGTGFYIDKHYILTNQHVVTRETYNGKERIYNEYDEFRIPYRRVELIAWDPDVDLALLYDRSENTDAVATFSKYSVEIGEDIVSFGYPLLGTLSYHGNGTSGIVSGLSGVIRDLFPENVFQHTAPTQGGNSGGSVFNLSGNVVGVSVSGLHSRVEIKGDRKQVIDINPPQNANFAIKFDVIKNFLERVKESKEVLDFLKKNRFASLDYKSTENLGKDIPLQNIYIQAQKFTVPVLCYKNKGKPLLDVIEVKIDGLNR